MEPPEHLTTALPLPKWYALQYWTAYSDLQHERPPNLYKKGTGEPIPQRIPWSAIARYATFHAMNVDELKRIVWACDSEFIGDISPEPDKDEEQNGDG